MATRILVIDDDTGILEAVQALLEDEGYDVTLATNGAVSLDLIQGTMALPDLILLDVLLSGDDGRDVCRTLKGDSRTQHIPIIMMSAHPNVRSSVQACGANSFLAKPYDIDDLLNQVEANQPRALSK